MGKETKTCATSQEIKGKERPKTKFRGFTKSMVITGANSAEFFFYVSTAFLSLSSIEEVDFSVLVCYKVRA
jgi:hypothetical protein